MAVATPVLEREINKQETYGREYRENFMTADERHNLRISENYAKLINPETTMRDIKSAPVNRVEETYEAPAEVKEEKPYLVENARADADIFRAESAVNRPIETAAAVQVETDEEENEDLRPTQTTIQYKTAGVKKNVSEGKISTKDNASRSMLSKKDKIIIAVALTIIVALFILIIVNSAVISNLNRDVSSLQENLNTAQNEYAQSLAEKQTYLEEDNLYQVVSDFAYQNGMVLR